MFVKAATVQTEALFYRGDREGVTGVVACAAVAMPPACGLGALCGEAREHARLALVNLGYEDGGEWIVAGTCGRSGGGPRYFLCASWPVKMIQFLSFSKTFSCLAARSRLQTAGLAALRLLTVPDPGRHCKKRGPDAIRPSSAPYARTARPVRERL
jgi:hypothetical protein